MRCDQFAGLNERALKLVKGEQVFVCTEEVTRIYPDGRRVVLEPRQIFEPSVKKEASGESYAGMFDEEYPLSKYTFSDGRVYFEKLQAAPWSSGPVHFLALQDKDGKWVPKSLWTNKEIQKNT